jgi:hypothetical protein
MCPYHPNYCVFCSPRGIECPGHDETSDEDSSDGQICPHSDEGGVVEEQTEQISELLSVVSGIKGIEGIDEWVSVVEGLAILMYKMSRARNVNDLIADLLAYLKGITSTSLFGLVMKQFRKLPQEERVIEPHAWTAADVKQKWTLLRTNSIFGKISYLISAVLSMTVCKINGVEWTVNGFEIFALPAMDKQMSAVSVMDAFVDVLEWTATTGYRIIEEKSLNPLFYSDNRIEQFNTTYMNVVASADSILNGNSGDMGDFEKEVDDLLCTCEYVRKTKANSSLSLWIFERYNTLMSLKERIIAKRRNTAIRFRPFGIGLTGPSGVGKSTLAKIVMKTALVAMGFEYNPDRIITKDMFDKYDSTMTSDVQGIYIDDMGNGKAQFVVTSPTDIIIKFFNNMAATAVKAELASKGVVFIDFKVGVITSNHVDYSVPLYTEIVEASLSRILHTRVSVKPEYRLPGSIALNPAHPDLVNASLVHDLWELTIEKSVLCPNLPAMPMHKFQVVEEEIDGKMVRCEKLDLKTYLKVIVSLAKKHKLSQYDVMKRSKDFDEAPCCEHCCMVKPYCECDTKPHSQELIQAFATSIFGKICADAWDRVYAPFQTLAWVMGFRPIRAIATRQLAREVSYAMNTYATPFLIACTPQFVFETRFFQYIVFRWQHTAAICDLKPWIRLVMGYIVVGSYIAYDNKAPDLFVKVALSGYFWILLLYAQYCARCQVYKSEYLARSDALRDMIRAPLSSNAKNAAAALAGVLIGIKMVHMWLKSREIQPNSSLVSDDSPGWFGFIDRMKVQVGAQKRVAHASTDQVASKVSKNVCFATFARPDGSETRSDVFFPRKGVMWMPAHVFHPKSDMSKPRFNHLRIQISRGKGPGSRFEQAVSVDQCVFTDRDLVVVNVAKSPDFATLTSFLPTSLPTGSSMAQLIVRDKEFELQNDAVSVEYCQTAHMYRSFYGGKYRTNLAKVGACMGPLILDGKTPVVVGFHIGGDNYGKGVMQTVLLSDHERWLEQLVSIRGNFVGAESNDFPSIIMGKQVISGPVHAHAEASRLPDSAPIEVLGSTRLRMSQKSVVEKSILSDAVADEFGVESKWGPPKLLPNWKAFNATLEHMADPGITFFPDELERARQDWLKPLMAKVGAIPDIRPLTLKEAILGIPGEKFIDPLNMTTSMCHPIYQSKRKHFEDVVENGVLVDRIPSNEIKFELERVETCWKNGKRANVVWSSTLKDEPTVVTKDKVRVFQGSPVVLSILMRKYFLKIVRFLGFHSIESECAVGINAFGPHWQTLMRHASKYSDGRTDIGWDYSKFDVKMISQITIAVYVSLIELAQAHGYSDEDLYIMRMMIYDVVHPFLDYNGTLLQVFNMNASGNSLTVIVNSIANSLYVRMGFFSIYPEQEDFRSCVAAVTYGDDFIGSVKPEFSEFNFVSFKRYLAKYSVKITHPSKSDKEEKFLGSRELDFLKRTSNYIPEIDREIGKLEEDSIFKSLHANLKSKEATKREVAAACVESAAHEWFAHGRDTYVDRCRKLEAACKKVRLPVPALNLNYDDRVEHWKEKYE